MATPIRIPSAKPLVGEAEIEAVLAVLRSGMLVEGAKVRELERLFADYLGVKHVLAVVNGTMAIYAALEASGIGDGDCVLVPDYTFAATAAAVCALHAKPILVDIDPQTFTIRVDLVEQALDKWNCWPKAILPVHLYGYPAEIEALQGLARRFGVALIEDAAQSHGAAVGSKKVGTFGTGCFSLYATKNVFTGEGGLVTTNDDHVAANVFRLAHHGADPDSPRYTHLEPGLNLRMADLLAALAIPQMAKIDEWTSARQENARQLTEGLSEVRGIGTPVVEPGTTHVFHQYAIRVKPEFPLTRDELQRYLAEQGIGSAVHYPSALHEQPAFQTFDRLGGEEAEKASRETLCLPVGPWLKEGETEEITRAIKQASLVRV